MDTTALFLASDAALKSVVDRIDPAGLERPVPSEWSRSAEPTLRTVLAYHVYDEAWIPDVVQGVSASDGDDLKDRDLLGDDPIAAYDRVHATATAAVTRGVAPDTTFRFQYGDYPAEEGFVHLAVYRAFQAWSIAHLLGLGFRLPDDVVAGMEEHVVPHVDEWRGLGVFPPAVEPPEDADRETRLLCTTGFWRP